jgi:hypothetical protein
MIAETNSPSTSENAMHVLYELGSEGRHIVQAALEDPAAPNRAVALRLVLDEVWNHTNLPPAIALLLRYIRDSDTNVQRTAAAALEPAGRSVLVSEAVVQAWAEALQSSRDAFVRCRALDALGATAANVRAPDPIALAALRNPDAGVRSSATNTLRRAANAIPIMVACLRDPDLDVQEEAAFALGRAAIEPNLVIPALIDAAQTSTNLLVRRLSIGSLGDFGPRARAAVPYLQAALADPDFSTRMNATGALCRIAPDLAPETPHVYPYR